jgi:hypothetical protein
LQKLGSRRPSGETPVLLHLDPPVDTILAVTVGAVLATLGGFVATEMEARLRRKERERGAALLFGELLTALATIIRIADQSRGHGDPFGPFTLRMLRAAQRETDAYERNRGALYDLRDGRLRLEIHVLMVRTGLALEGVFETTADLAEIGSALRKDAGDSGSEARSERLAHDRIAAFEAAVESVGEFRSLLGKLEDAYEFSGNPYPEMASPA